MTRQKEGDSSGVILVNLLYHKGNSLNNHVTKDLFDGTIFTLKLPSIDGFAHDIINTKNDPVLVKVDEERGESSCGPS